MDEIKEEVLEILNKIYGITIKIKRVYKQLLILQYFKKDNPNYDLLINYFINKLKTLLNLEDEAYFPFEENYLYTNTALSELIRIQNVQKTDETNRLILERIINKLSKIQINTMSQNIEVFINQLLSLEGVKYLIGRGLDEECSVEIVLGYSKVLRDSMARRFVNIVNSDIDSIKSDSIKFVYLKRKYDKSFTISSEVEKDLISSQFTTVKNDFDKDLETNFKLSKKGKARLISLQAEENLSQILDSLITKNDPEELDELLIYFKTYIHYLDEYGLMQMRKKISILEIMFPSLNNIKLLQKLDTIESLRKKQSVDTHNNFII